MSLIKKLEDLALLQDSGKQKADLVNPRIVYLDPRIIALQRELQHHTELVRKYEHLGGDLVAVLENLGVETEVLLDGMYTGEDLLRVADIITGRLYKKRQSLIIT